MAQLQKAKSQRMKVQHAKAVGEVRKARREADELGRAVEDAQRAARKAQRAIKAVQRAAMLRKVKPRRSTFEIQDAASKKVTPTDSETFSSLAVASITRVSKTDDGLQFALSNGLNLNVEPRPFGMAARLLPNPEWSGVVSARVWLVRPGERDEPTAVLIERRLWHLRQLYALLFLLLTDDIERVADFLDEDLRADLEQLIPQELWLCVRGLGEGTVWVDVAVDVAKKAYEKVKAAPEAALNAISIISREGRELWMRRVRASTRKVEAGAALAEAQAGTAQAKTRQANAAADRAEQIAIQERFKTAKSQIQMIQAIDAATTKIKNPKLKKLTENRLRGDIAGLLGTKDERSLPPPS